MSRLFAVFIAAAAAVTTMTIPEPAEAGKVIGTRVYEASGLFLRYDRGDPTCEGRRRPCTITRDGAIDAGGVEFPALGGRSRSAWVRLRIIDDVDPVGAMRFLLCQDNKRNGTCGETDRGETSYHQCSPGAPSMRVSTRHPITVFVIAAWGCPQYLVPDATNRPGVATTGRVRLSYA